MFIIEIAGGLDRHWRRGLTSLAVLLALSVGSILAVGWQSQVDYLEFLRTLSGSQTAFWGNQSLMGAGLRLFTDMPVLWYGFELDPNLRVVSLIVLGSLGVVAAVVQLGSRVRHPIATPALWLAAALLGLSLSWEHHSILLLPAVAYLWTQRPTATGTGLLILATLALGLNLTPLFNDLGVGRVLACIPALGRLTLFLILVLYHLKIDLILKPLPKDA